MSEERITIRADIKAFKEDLNEVRKGLEELREYASDSGKGIDKAMRQARTGLDVLQIGLTQTNKEMRDYKAELARMKDLLASQNVSLRGAKSAQDALTTAINKTYLKTQNQTEAQRIANATRRRSLRALGEEAMSYDQVKDKIGALNNTKKQYQNQADTLRQRLIQLRIEKRENEKATTGLTSGYRGLIATANRLAGVFGFGVGLYGAMRLLRSAVSTIQDFELAQKQLEAVTGATASQMDNFSKEAIRVGSSSIYGAEGVTRLQVQLAKMGFTIPQINQMTESIVRLAMATQEDLGKAAETVAFTIRAYQLDARDATRVTDTMARSFTASALDLEKFRQSMKYIAPIANQANFTLEETVAILGKVADAGISGSLAGTSMRNIIFQLSDSASELSKRTDVTVQGFDDFTEALWRLHSAGTDLEDVFSIMDRRAASVFTLLIESVDTLDAFRDKILEAGGSAEHMANIQMESLAYHTQIARRSWEGFILALDQGDGVISRSLKGLLSTFSNTMGSITRQINLQSTAINNEIDALDTLHDMILNHNITHQTRMHYFRELQAMYPEHLSNLTEDAIKTGELTRAVQGLREHLETPLKHIYIEEQIAEVEQNLKQSIRDLRRFEEITSGGQMNIFDTFRYINIGWRHMRQEGEDLYEQLNSAVESYMWKLGELQRSLQDAHKSTLPVEEYVDRYHAMNKEISGSISKIRELRQEFLDAGHSARYADEESMKIFYKKIASQEKVIVGQIKGLEVQRDSGELSEEQLELNAEHIRARQIEVAILRKIEDEVRAILDAEDDRDKVTKERERNRVQEEERRLRLAFEGVELEKQIADIRRDSAMRIADEIYGLETIEGGRLAELAMLEHKLALQNASIGQMREENRLTDEALAVQRSLQDTQAKMFEEQMRLEHMRIDPFDVEGRFDVDKRLLESHYENRRREIENGLADEERAIERSYKERVDQMEATEGLSEAQLRDHYATLAKYAEERDIRRAQAKEKSDQALLLMEQEYTNAVLELSRSRTEEELRIEAQRSEIRMRHMEIRHEKERTLLESRRHTQEDRRELERRHHIERLKEQKHESEMLLRLLKLEKERLMTEGDPGGRLGDINRQIESVTQDIDLLAYKIAHPPFDMQAWNQFTQAMLSNLNEITSALQRAANEREQFYRREREMMDRHVDEAAKAIDRELRLREQGFASDVEASLQYHEKMRRLRREAVQEEQQAAVALRRTEGLVQAINLASSASNILKNATKTYTPLVGLGVGAAAIATLFGIWSNVRRQSQAATMYTKGGSFVLEGASHSQGGVPLAPRHEAQGGEGVSVWNRGVTRKYWPEIKSLTDSINKGKGVPSGSNVNVFANNRDIAAMRKLMEAPSEEYRDGYKIVKHGNHTIRCRLN